MKILEIKNNLVKIGYEVSDNLALSEFLIIEDSNNPYVAQIMNVKSDALTNFVIAKLLFTFNEEGILKNYNGTIPSLKATVSKLPSNELLDIIPVENPLFLGNIAQQNIALKVDKTILDNNLLICSDNLANTSELLTNITQQLSEKTVIFDTLGQFDTNGKVMFGRDFKLPLNAKTIDFIYENDLDDVDPVNKAVIQDIFIEVQDYIKTLPEQFLPFDTFLNVVDSQYKETQIPELVLLKNKLLKYKELDVFAQDLKDVLSLSIVLEKSDLTVIDISNIPEAMQRELFDYIYGVMNSINEKIYAFAKVDNSIITKRLLKRFIDRDNVYTTIICPHEFKYISEVKEASQNIIFFAPLTVTHDFASYNSFLNKLNADEFVVYGAHTQNIPLIVEIAEPPSEEGIDNNEEESMLEESSFPSVVYPDIETDMEDSTFEDDEQVEVDTQIIQEPSENDEPEIVENNLSEEEPVVTENFIEEFDEETEEKKNPEPIVYDDIADVDNPSDDVQIVEEQEEPQIVEDEDLTPDDSTFEEESYDEIDEPQFEEVAQDEQEIQYEEEPRYQEEDKYSDNFEEQLEDEPVVEPLETPEDVQAIDEDLNEPIKEEVLPPDDELVEQVAKDVDKIFYEKIPQEDELVDSTPEIVEDELTEDDLNIIDDLASDDIQLAGGDVQDFPPIDDEEKPPIVPIYEADDIEDGDNKLFNPGDRVSTPKFGEGVVNKMVKYGDKMLCYVDFPNIGKRLIDPSLTQLTKIDEM